MESVFRRYTRLLLIIASLVPATGALAAPKSESPEALLARSQEQFQKEDHDGALTTLQKYFSRLVTTPKQKAKTRLRFFAIAAMGRIYLQYKHDPKGAVGWFEKLKSDPSLTEAEQDIVGGWITAAKDWIALGKFPSTTSTEQELFDTGKRYYEAGLKKQKFPMDQAGTADFSIAQSFLVPFLVHFDKSKNASEVLFMMGDMRRRLWTDNRFWSENHYLTEAIRRFPNTPIAVRAFDALKEDVEFAYSGSSGVNVPKSWEDLLSVLDRLAHGKEVPLPGKESGGTAKPLN
ncbi:MAG: hypothetical protein EBX52_05775 [Proteobacteria bacterium]|nr:hypothetical protein [Pseudomonadota bacterium]